MHLEFYETKKEKGLFILEIKKRGDLIIDTYGNYYYAIDQKGSMLRLVNAFMDLTFRRRLDAVYYEEYHGGLIGDRPMELLKGNIEMILNNKSKLKMISLEEVEKHFDVIIEPLYHPEK